MANKNQTGKRPNKVFALVTYIVALVALLLGMFLPFGNKVGSEGIQAMWACQLPAALAEAFPVPALKELVAGIGVEFTYSLPVTFNGWLPESYDLGALFTVLYALVVLAGIIALIPAIVSTCRKRVRKTPRSKRQALSKLSLSFSLRFSSSFNFRDYPWAQRAISGAGRSLPRSAARS